LKSYSRLTALAFGVWFAASSLSAQADPGKAATAKKKAAPHQIFNGYAVPEARLRAQPIKRSSGHIEMYSLNAPKELVSVDLYNADGSYNDDAVEQLTHLWRCRRTETEKSIDPHLFEVISQIYDHFKKPIALVSGFRNQRRVTSFHYVGSASDITIQGLPDGKLKSFVEGLDTGGMGIGIYPHAGFIHVDVRPEPSYRWVDYSPPGSSDMGQPKTKRPRSPNT